MPRRLRSMILARSYSAIIPWTWTRRFSAGSWPSGIAEEDDLDVAAGELLEDQDLVGILAGEAIRVLDVESVEGAGGGLVAEPLQARPQEDGPADAVVDEPQLRVAVQAVVADAAVERLELAGDRALLGLPLGGDPGVERHAEGVVVWSWSRSRGRGPELAALRPSVAGFAGAAPGGARRRETAGMTS